MGASVSDRPDRCHTADDGEEVKPPKETSLRRLQGRAGRAAGGPAPAGGKPGAEGTGGTAGECGGLNTNPLRGVSERSPCLVKDSKPEEPGPGKTPKTPSVGPRVGSPARLTPPAEAP